PNPPNPPPQGGRGIEAGMPGLAVGLVLLLVTGGSVAALLGAAPPDLGAILADRYIRHVLVFTLLPAAFSTLLSVALALPRARAPPADALSRARPAAAPVRPAHGDAGDRRHLRHRGGLWRERLAASPGGRARPATRQLPLRALRHPDRPCLLQHALRRPRAAGGA